MPADLFGNSKQICCNPSVGPVRGPVSGSDNVVPLINAERGM